jgi:hypothetical protein
MALMKVLPPLHMTNALSDGLFTGLLMVLCQVLCCPSIC